MVTRRFIDNGEGFMWCSMCRDWGVMEDGAAGMTWRWWCIIKDSW